jgi:CelD/BcsL family acetyltransferase involved in cellulose biosynthesis
MGATRAGQERAGWTWGARVVELKVQKELGPFREQWDRLVATDPSPPTDMTSWWLESLGGTSRRFVLLVDGDRLLAGLPVHLAHRRGVVDLRLLGGEFWPAGADVVADPAAAASATHHLGRWLRSHRHCTVDFNGVRPDSLLRAALPTSVREIDLPGSPIIDLSDGYHKWQEQRSRNFRKDLRRHERRLHGEGVRYRTLSPAETEWGLDCLRELHEQRFGAHSAFLPHFERFAAAAPAGVARRELVLHVLTTDERIIAIEATLEVGGWVSSVQTAMAHGERRFRGAGTVLLAKILEYADHHGLRGLELGREPSDYKARWTDDIYPVKRLTGAWGWRPSAVSIANRSRARAARQASGLRRRTRRAVAR